jgi:hypothetical protein
MARVFVIQLRRAMAFLLTPRLSEQRKLSNRNATTRRAPGGPQMHRNAGGPDGNLVVAVAVQYASWGTFEARSQHISHRLIVRGDSKNGV